MYVCIYTYVCACLHESLIRNHKYFWQISKVGIPAVCMYTYLRWTHLCKCVRFRFSTTENLEQGTTVLFKFFIQFVATFSSDMRQCCLQDYPKSYFYFFLVKVRLNFQAVKNDIFGFLLMYNIGIWQYSNHTVPKYVSLLCTFNRFGSKANKILNTS